LGGFLHLPVLLSVLVSLAPAVFSGRIDLQTGSFQRVAGKAPLESAIYFGPWAIGGLLFAMFSGLMLHVIPGRILLIISGISKAVALLFFALMPEHPNYWAWILPAMIFETACVDIIWTVSNVYLTTSLPKDRQGLAGALINFTLFIGSAFFVGVADITAGELKKETSMSLKVLYQYIFWLGFGVACLAMILSLFIRLDKASSRLTGEEEVQLSKQHSDSLARSMSFHHGFGQQPDCCAAVGLGYPSSEGGDQGGWGTVTLMSEREADMDWDGATEMGMTEKMANVVLCETLEDQRSLAGEARKAD
jgi:MFS family permease